MRARLIADKKGKQVLRFAPNGTFVGKFAGIEAGRLALNHLDDVAMIDREKKSVVIFDRDGKRLRYEIRRARADGRYRVVITQPDGTESIEEVKEPTELIEPLPDGAVAPGAAAPTQNIENNPMHSSQVVAGISIFC